MTGDVGGDSNAGLVLSALHGAAGRRANGSRGIKVGKAHAVLGQLIDVGRIDKIVSVTAHSPQPRSSTKMKTILGLALFSATAQLARMANKKAKEDISHVHLIS